jgi:hypothetical protein
VVLGLTNEYASANDEMTIKETSATKSPLTSMGLREGGHASGAMGSPATMRSELIQSGVKTPEIRPKMPTDPSISPPTEPSLSFQSFNLVPSVVL